MNAAIATMTDNDVILIDTAGRSQRDDSKLSELSEFLEAARPDQVHLVLYTTHGETTIQQTIAGFAPVGVTQAIFTKLDEEVGMGVVLSALKDVKIRLSSLTNAKHVPALIAP